jgi:ABC-type polysaccharide/polyol phosphate export permease
MDEHGNWRKIKKILELSWSLAKANFKLRNEGSYLGIFWYLLEPLLMFAVILLVAQGSNLSQIESYPVYLLIGLIVFNFFSGTTILASNSIANNAIFLKSMKINSEAFVISQVIQSIFSHLFELIVLVILMLAMRLSILGILFYLILFIFIALFVLGVSFILATIGVYVTDISNVWNVLSRILWFITPIFYFSPKGANLFLINLFNPMFYFISIARSVLIQAEFPELWLVLGACAFSIIFFVLGIFIFEKYKNEFAEVL